MKVILKKDIEKLGFKYDQVNVKPGYARNYLIPNGYAITATKSSIKQYNELLKQSTKKESLLIKQSTEKIEQIKSLNIKIYAKVGLNEKLFGTINSKDISDFLLKKGIEINKKFINTPNIKKLGIYQVTFLLHKKVNITIPIEVLSYKEKKISNK